MTKTVKELSDELGVSRQRIQQLISKQSASKKPRMVAGQYQLDKDFCDMVISQLRFTSSKRTHTSGKQVDTSRKQVDTSRKQVDTSRKQVDTSSKKIIEILKGQLKIKDGQIENKDEQIKDLQKLLDQSQQLQLIAEHKIQQLEAPKEEDKDNLNDIDSKRKRNFWNIFK